MNMEDLFGDQSGISKYSNHAEIGHNMVEIRIRFNFVGAGNVGRLQSEIVMSPVVAKALLHLLTEEIKLFETNVAPIYMPDDKSGLEALFGGQIEDGNDKRV